MHSDKLCLSAVAAEKLIIECVRGLTTDRPKKLRRSGNRYQRNACSFGVYSEPNICHARCLEILVTDSHRLCVIGEGAGAQHMAMLVLGKRLSESIDSSCGPV